MPGVATAQLLTYAEVVDVDLDATNDVNFADVEDYGHRVVVEMNTDALNNYLGWYRAVGEARPKAMLDSTKESAFKAALEAALAGGYVDIDGVTNGLHFGTANLSTNPDPRIRKDGLISANDLPLCFVLYKLYGSSAVATLDNIYNMADAYEMLSNATVATAVTESFKGEVAGALDTMFRDLLAADPHRFFDASGIPAAGIFETRNDAYGSGTWKLVADDTLEVKLKMIFHSRVTRRGVAGREHNLTSTETENAAGAQENQQTVINPDDYFYVRLQIKSTPAASPGGGGDEGSGSGSGSGSGGGGSSGGVPTTSITFNVSQTTYLPASTDINGFIQKSPITLTAANNWEAQISYEDGGWTAYAYTIGYDPSIDEFYTSEGYARLQKYHKVGSEYVGYFDQYGRESYTAGAVKITVVSSV
jgi:hypothetical protein